MPRKKESKKAVAAAGGKDEFNPEKFVKLWKIVTGKGHRDDCPCYAVITREGEKFRLFSIKGEETKFVQELEFNSRTKTLDNTHPPGRSISYWKRKETGPRYRDCIFAMRRKPEKGAAVSPLAHWETDGDDGTWGGEEGGG